MSSYRSVITLCLLAISFSTCSANDATYAVVFPTSVRPASTFPISCTIFQSSGSVSVTARLLDGMNMTIVQAQAMIPSDSSDTISLQIPGSLTKPPYTVSVSGQGGGISFSNSSQVEVKTKTLSLFVQTDKAMYKPGHTVKFRALAVYPDLKPFKGEMDIKIFDTAGNKIRQWLKEKSENGVFTSELELSDQTPVGEWTIEVNAQDNTFKKTFEVAEYVLPKYEVKIGLPSYFLVNTNNRGLQEGLTASVSAKYTYGQPVKGKVVLTVQIKPYSYYDSATYPKKTLTAELIQGKIDFSLKFNDLLNLVPTRNYGGSYTPDLVSDISYRTLLFTANVTEEVTGKSLATNNTVDCKNMKYQLEFLEITPDVYKPSLMFNGFLQLKQVDGSPPMKKDIQTPNGQPKYVKITVTTDMYPSKTIHVANISIPESGLMMFSFMLSDTINTSISIRAEFWDSVTNMTTNAYRSVQKFESKSGEGVQLSLSGSEGVIKPGEVVTFNVKSTKEIDQYFYQILSKGVIILNQAMTGPRAFEHQFSITFDADLAQKLSPSARIVVWYLTATSEIITDSLEVNVEGAFANQVSLTFDKEQVSPGNKVALTVNAHQGSYIGILAVDQSVLLLKSGNDITQDMVLEELRNYDSSNRFDGPMPMPLDDVAVRGRRKRCLCGFWWPIFSGGKDSYEIFQNAGVVILTDALVYKKPQIQRYWREFEMMGPVDAPAIAGAPGQAEAAGPDAAQERGASGSAANDADSNLAEPTRTRTEFPEAWLFSELVSGPDGTSRIEADVPDTITSWVASAFAMSDDVGMGVADTTAKVTVFKPFFVSLNLPYSIIRGEEFALQVTVFNYLQAELQVTITLEKSDDFKVRHPNSIEPEARDMVANEKIPSNDARTVYFWIVAESLGQIPINVKAQSVAAADAVRRMLLVKPEGIPQEYSTSLLINLNNGESMEQNLEASLPPDSEVVKGSEHVTVTAIGDIMGASINGLDSLIKMPYGCGEQNMLNFAPNIYVLRYLKLSGQITPELEQKSVKYMLSGYQRELTYQRKDGSFSAFGDRDDSGSVWLSSFVIKCFHEAMDYISVDERKIAETLRWIINNQFSNGSFGEPPNGRVIHTDMQGGSSKGVAMTAYVLIALMENADNTVISPTSMNRARQNAMRYLESQLNDVSSDSYALAIISYALMLSNSTYADTAFQKLNQLAKVKDGMKFWEKVEEKKEEADDMWHPPYSQARSVNIETTSYALLCYAHKKDIVGGIPIVKWIVSQRNPNGGFSSTQDTVMALQALSAFASLISGPSTVLDLSVSITAGTKSHSFDRIRHENSLVLQSVEVPATSRSVAVTASGSGIGLVQLNVKYNVKQVKKDTSVVLTVNSKENKNQVSVESCGSWMNGEKKSGMMVMEVEHLSGYSPVNTEELMQQGGGTIKRVESDDKKVVLYFDELTGKQICVTVVTEKVHMVSNIQRAAVSAYSYYDPDEKSTELYLPFASEAVKSWCEECPSCCQCDPVTQVTCGDMTCVSRTAMCNGVRDCNDGADEKGCSCGNTRETYRCLSGECVPVNVLCDGNNDCFDRSDEIQCVPKVGNPPPTENPNSASTAFVTSSTIVVSGILTLHGLY